MGHHNEKIEESSNDVRVLFCFFDKNIEDIERTPYGYYLRINSKLKAGTLYIASNHVSRFNDQEPV